jgi:hypothetical protein
MKLARKAMTEKMKDMTYQSALDKLERNVAKSEAAVCKYEVNGYMSNLFLRAKFR